jgi:hypothetical protein
MYYEKRGARDRHRYGVDGVCQPYFAYVLKFVGGSVGRGGFSDPCRVATFFMIGSCFSSKVFVNMKSDIALSKSMHPLGVGAGAVFRGFVQ